MTNNLKYNTHCLLQMVYSNNVQKVAELIPYSDPKAQNSEALRLAAAQGYLECVKLLIPVSDCKSNHSQALAWAVLKGHNECVEALYDHSEPYDVLKTLDSPQTAQECAEFQSFIARKERTTLEQAVVGAHTLQARRKI